MSRTPLWSGMRVDHPHLWGVLHRLHLAHDADPSKLEEWRRAPEGSQEEIWASHYDEAMGVLATALEQLGSPEGAPSSTPILITSWLDITVTSAIWGAFVGLRAGGCVARCHGSHVGSAPVSASLRERSF
jgi:hypothetical protein